MQTEAPSEFKWLDDITYYEVIQNFDCNCDDGYAIEVDLEYAEKLHNNHWTLTFRLHHIMGQSDTTSYQSTSRTSSIGSNRVITTN